MIKNILTDKLKEISSGAASTLDTEINSNIKRIQTDINNKVQGMVTQAEGSAQEDFKHIGVNESDYLKYIADERNLRPISIFAFGLFLSAILPGFMQFITVMVFIVGGISLYTSYIKECKVNVDEGFDGVITNWGEPTGKMAGLGRKRYWKFNEFCTFQVSTKELFSEASISNYTSDFGSMGFSPEVVFKISDNILFLKTTTPAGIVKIIKLYSKYIGLRMITSMDARCKFVGTKEMINFRDALNIYLKPFGVEVTSVTLPRVSNPVLGDLEIIQTQLKKIEQLGVEKQAEMENAIKTVESQIRTNTKMTRSKANELAQTEVQLTTIIAAELNNIKQANIVDARKELVEKKSELISGIQTFIAQVEKAKALRGLLGGVQKRFDLELAKAKRIAYEAMVPKEIVVINVPGMEAGLLLDTARKIMAPKRQLPEPKDNRKTVPKVESVICEDERLSEE